MKKFLENKKVQNILSYLVVIVLALILNAIINGISLKGVPDWEEIDRIEISSEEFGGQIKTYEEKYNCIIASSLFINAKHTLINDNESDFTNAISVKFFVDDEEYVGMINEKYVMWQGKTYKLKEEPEVLIAAKTNYFLESTNE